MSGAQILAHFTVESPWETKSPPLTISPPPFEKNPLNFVYLSLMFTLSIDMSDANAFSQVGDSVEFSFNAILAR